MRSPIAQRPDAPWAKRVIALILENHGDLAGERLRSGDRLTARALLATMLRELPILVGAAIPLVTLLLCWIAGTGRVGRVWLSFRNVRRTSAGGM
jgi:hypothetical protein